MDPITMAVAGGSIMSGLGGIFGAKEGNRAARANEKINERNFEASQEARKEAIEFAKKLHAEDRLGVTDAMGNRVYYDPERGWVTELSPLQQRIADMVQREQHRQATEGAARGRMSEDRQSDAAEAAGVRGEAMGREFDRTQRLDEGRISDLLYARGQGARNQSQDRLMEGINRAMVRGGNTSNFADMVSSRASADADSARQGRIEADLAGRDYTQSDFNARRGASSDLLNQFTRQASYSPQYNLSSPQGPQGQQSRQGAASLFAALQGSAPQQDYISPNYSNAQAMGNIGQAMTGFGGYLQGRQDTNKLLEAMMMRD